VLARLGDGGAGEQGREGGGASRLGEDANLVPEPMLRFADRVVRDQDDALDVVGDHGERARPSSEFVTRLWPAARDLDLDLADRIGEFYGHPGDTELRGDSLST
jgi:hypothetical protein